MIDLYSFPTPNGQKIAIALEAMGLDYRVRGVNILEREQFSEDFLNISPNNKIPAIVDHQPLDGGEPISVFESGAILIYLAEKTGQLLPIEPRARKSVLEWLMWQVGGLGPMAGQANHFCHYARESVPYGITRYSQELARLYGVMNARLKGRDYLCDEFSIADIACYGWVAQASVGRQRLADFANLQAWFRRMGERQSVQKGMAVGVELSPPARLNDSQHASLFAAGLSGQVLSSSVPLADPVGE